MVLDALAERVEERLVDDERGERLSASLSVNHRPPSTTKRCMVAQSALTAFVCVGMVPPGNRKAVSDHMTMDEYSTS